MLLFFIRIALLTFLVLFVYLGMAKDKTSIEADYQRIIDGLIRVADGDFAVEIPATTNDPGFNAMARSFNKMINSLRAMVNELRETRRRQDAMISRFKRIFDGSKDIILYINKYGTIVDINKSVKEILGYEPDEIKGKHFAKAGVVLEQEIENLLKMFNIAIKKGIGKDIMRLGFRTKDRRILYMDASIRLLKSEDEIDGAIIVLRDVTEHIEMDQRLQMEKEKLKAVVSSMEDLVLVLDSGQRLVEYYRSELCAEHFIFAGIDQYSGKQIKGFFPGSVYDGIEKAIQQSAKTSKVQWVEYSITVKKQEFWFSVRIFPLFDAEKNSIGTTLVISDTTSHRQMEKALADSEKKYRQIFEQSPQGFIILDAEGKILDVNKKICEWLGYKPDEIVGKDHIMYPFLTKSGKIVAMRKFIQRLSGKYVMPYELEFVAKDGNIFIGEVDARAVKDEKGNIDFIVVMITDVTRRHS